MKFYGKTVEELTDITLYELEADLLERVSSLKILKARVHKPSEQWFQRWVEEFDRSMAKTVAELDLIQGELRARGLEVTKVNG